MIKVGITGGIGSGKSTVARIFETLHIPVYYADERAKWLMNNNQKVMHSIEDVFGRESYINGALNREHIAHLVFNDQDLLARLNAIVHPAVQQDALYWHQQQTSPYTLQEAALFFENGSYASLDKIILVTADKELRIERVMKRNGFTRHEVLSRMNNQWEDDEKRAKSDFEIINNHQQSLVDQVVQIHSKLKAI